MCASHARADGEVGSLRQPLLFGDEHRQYLAATGEQGGKRLGIGIGERPGRGLYDLGKVGEQVGVEGISLGELAARLREVPHLAGVDDRDGEAGGSQGRGHGTSWPPVASSTISVGVSAVSLATRPSTPSAVVALAHVRSARVDRHGELGFTDIHTHHRRLHDAPQCHRMARPYASAESRPDNCRARR